MIVLLNKKNKTKFLVHKHFLKDEIYQIIHGILKIDHFENNENKYLDMKLVEYSIKVYIQ